MTKSELAKMIASKYPYLYAKDIQNIIDDIFAEITQSLSDGYRIELRGFGAFSLRQRKPRVARNPKTEQRLELGARHSLYFRASKELREKLNSIKNVKVS